jgi:hypothetical protein
MIEQLADGQLAPESFINRRVTQLREVRKFEHDLVSGVDVFCQKGAGKPSMAQGTNQFIPVVDNGARLRRPHILYLLAHENTALAPWYEKQALSLPARTPALQDVA